MPRLVIPAVVVFFVLPAFGQAPKPSASPTPAASPKAAVAPKPSASPQATASPGAAKAVTARNQVTGTVVSVDEGQSTITFKDAKEQTTTWKVEGKALDRLKTLKAGDKVKIHYTMDDKGAPKAAVAIRPASKGKKDTP
ncbi:MAG TPA: hypothetical protein VFM88_00210 [Vicinamibacteria bacterium]|nr:hypothetical protein [Vicinamibacteria bacterium]